MTQLPSCATLSGMRPQTGPQYERASGAIVQTYTNQCSCPQESPACVCVGIIQACLRSWERGAVGHIKAASTRTLHNSTPAGRYAGGSGTHPDTYRMSNPLRAIGCCRRPKTTAKREAHGDSGPSKHNRGNCLRSQHCTLEHVAQHPAAQHPPMHKQGETDMINA